MASSRGKRVASSEVLDRYFADGSGDEGDFDDAGGDLDDHYNDSDIFDDDDDDDDSFVENLEAGINESSKSASSSSLSVSGSGANRTNDDVISGRGDSCSVKTEACACTVKTEETEWGIKTEDGECSVSTVPEIGLSDDEEMSDDDFVEPDEYVYRQDDTDSQMDLTSHQDQASHSDSDSEDQDEDWVHDTQNFPKVPPFSGQPGLKINLSDDSTAREVYKLIITDDVINKWTVETNRYARETIGLKKKAAANLSDRSRFKSWKPVTSQEMRRFLAVCLHMGLVHKPTLNHYWSLHPALHSSFCAKVMSRERFLSILAFLHVSNNADYIPYGEKNHDPIHKIRPFVEHLNHTFMSLYEPHRELCLSESVCPFKGRSRFKVFMKNKPAKWGFKLIQVCESKSGYVQRFEMYCADKRVSNKPVEVVDRLLEPLKDKGHHLYLDKAYCCPQLWDRLHRRRTMMCGACRKSCAGMPAAWFQHRQSPGQLDYRRKGQLVVTRWTDRREVVTLSTIHLPQLQGTHGRFGAKDKPVSVTDHAKHTAGLARSDQVVSFFPMKRKSQKWWKKLFFHLLTLVSVQTAILLNKHRRSKDRKALTLSTVVKEIVLSLVDQQQQTLETTASDTASLPNDRLSGKHFPSWCPQTPGRTAHSRRVCKVCMVKARQSGQTAAQSKCRRRLSRFWCASCKVGLCLEGCFEAFHTKVDFTK
ncbi:piggyBac transposable element-derived protein 4 [Aplysia californica]|uniref:PiggyBac transposable element-derived protein 4 n=1 Tax=Aplysia californica TaxID=6500 RepID=A0ABM0K7Y8_APLCA|nr:piggyBac transposable element-derived protein 4 [Aplysia californica]